MKTTQRQFDRKGSALILVIVVTVLLAAIAALFILMARVNEMASASADTERDLQGGVDTVVDHIGDLLVEELFSGTPVGPELVAYYDSPESDLWLADIEPEIDDNGTSGDASDDIATWNHRSYLWSGFAFSSVWYDPEDKTDATQWDGSANSADYLVGNERKVIARVVDPRDTTQLICLNGDWTDQDDLFDYGAIADADGDGVGDSRWVQLRGARTSDGKSIFAAVKIIDNNAMLNLNTAHSIGDTDSDYLGVYLSEVDFSDFLRGSDAGHPERIQIARKQQNWAAATPDLDTFEDYHDNVIMLIDSLSEPNTLFDISDELEIRNRFMLTSNTISRFEKSMFNDGSELATGVFPDYHGIGYYTFDYDRGDYTPSLTQWWGTKSRRIPIRDSGDFKVWKKRLNHDYWGLVYSGSNIDHEFSYIYDRRHVCTFYSYDRNIRASYPREVVLSQAPGIFFPEVGVADVRGIIPASDSDADILAARKKVLHLLYAFRAYFKEEGYSNSNAAARSAQVVANMIDNADVDGGYHPFDTGTTGSVAGFDDQDAVDMTYITNDIVQQLVYVVSGVEIDFADVTTLWPDSVNSDYAMSLFDFGLDASDVIYGYEPQPFLTEIVAESDGSSVTKFSMELYNPYGVEIDLDGWRITIGSKDYDIPSGMNISAGSRIVFDDSDFTGFDLSLGGGSYPLELKRPCPDDATSYLKVDILEAAQMQNMITALPPGPTYIIESARVDTDWEFTNYMQYYRLPGDTTDSSTLGAANSTSDTDTLKTGYQLSVDDDQDYLGTLMGLVRIPWVGNDSSKCITEYIADASDEGGIHFNYQDQDRPGLFNYVSLLERDNGRIPGRINVNTATKEVIKAAIPPSVGGGDWDREEIAEAIIADRPFTDVSEIYQGAACGLLFNSYLNDPNDNVGSSYGSDYEERDWLTSLVFNKFTVRSDVFTAYILVRIGVDGPEKRMIAIFDRSEVYDTDDKPKLVALKPVSDPR